MNPENEEKIYFYTEDLQVGYGGKQILNPVRIGIKKGEILTLVGPNGAGKTSPRSFPLWEARFTWTARTFWE